MGASRPVPSYRSLTAMSLRCIWASEAALHVEALKPRGPSLASRVRFGACEMMGRRLRMEDAVCVERGFRGKGDEVFFALCGHAPRHVTVT